MIDEQNDPKNHLVSRGKERFGNVVAWPKPPVSAGPAGPHHSEIGGRDVQSPHRPRIANLASHRPVVAATFFGSPASGVGKRRPPAGSPSENLAAEN